MVRNRAQNVASWTIEELTAILIRQFKRLLTERGLELTEQDIQALAKRAAARQVRPADVETLCAILRELIGESLDVLMGWGFSFAKSLQTGMDTLPGWETTADFLTLANEKGNAELRISAGAALLALLGDYSQAEKCWDTYRHGADDPEDVDAIIARRTLSFAAAIDDLKPENRADWEQRIQGWVKAHEK
jgi:hypothetical protein